MQENTHSKAQLEKLPPKQGMDKHGKQKPSLIYLDNHSGYSELTHIKTGYLEERVLEYAKTEHVLLNT